MVKDIHTLNSGILSWPTQIKKLKKLASILSCKKTDMLAGAVCLVLFHCSGVQKNKPLFVGQFRNWRKDLKHVQNHVGF